LRRVLPVIEALAREVTVLISIDTVKASVARAALAAGASLVNDTAAQRADAAMWELVAQSGAGYVCMHMQGAPPTMQLNPSYTDVCGEVADFFTAQLERLERAGVAREQVLLDPGIGFGKTTGHNLQLLRHLEHLTQFVRPVLLGLSRKSFIGQSVGAPVADRLPGSLACACWAVQHGVQILRAHDVAATVQAIRMTEALVAHNV
jgi:dihydropteroate synthase